MSMSSKSGSNNAISSAFATFISGFKSLEIEENACGFTTSRALKVGNAT